MIGVFAGDISELSNLINNIKIINSTTWGEATIKTGLINCKRITFCGCGFGKANVSAALGYILARCPLSSVICTGNCAQTDSANACFNSIAIATNSTQFDVDFSAIGYPSPLIPGLPIAKFQSNSDLIRLAQISSHLRNFNYSDGTIASGDTFVANDTLSKSIQENFNSSFIDNEAGPLSEICFINKIPFVCVKGVSNFANDTASVDYNNNLTQSNENANKVVNTMLTLMTKSKSN